MRHQVAVTDGETRDKGEVDSLAKRPTLKPGDQEAERKLPCKGGE